VGEKRRYFHNSFVIWLRKTFTYFVYAQALRSQMPRSCKNITASRSQKFSLSSRGLTAKSSL
jgi:hypothetical protein